MLRSIIKITFTVSAIVLSVLYAFLNLKSYFSRISIEEKSLIVKSGSLIDVKAPESKHIKALEITMQTASPAQKTYTLHIMAERVNLIKLKNHLDLLNISKQQINVKFDEGNFLWALNDGKNELIDTSIISDWNRRSAIYALWGGLTFSAIALSFLYFFLKKRRKTRVPG